VTETVVAGFIRTPEGQAALAAAVEETRRRRARLVIVHSARGGHEDADTVLNDRLALEEIEQQLRSDGLEVTVQDLARGNDPADDLLEVARDERAALVVIGMRRRTPVGKFVLGSNAQSILLHADCPVLAVKADAE
jgi:nucleotide-binding universal stress UspA family protein